MCENALAMREQFGLRGKLPARENSDRTNPRLLGQSVRPGNQLSY